MTTKMVRTMRLDVERIYRDWDLTSKVGLEKAWLAGCRFGLTALAPIKVKPRPVRRPSRR